MLDEVEDYEIMFIMYVISVMLTLMASLLSLHVENINIYHVCTFCGSMMKKETR